MPAGLGGGGGGDERRPIRKPSTSWNAGWFRDAQQASQGGVIEWVRK